jgi:hypothetical protein
VSVSVYICLVSKQPLGRFSTGFGIEEQLKLGGRLVDSPVQRPVSDRINQPAVAIAPVPLSFVTAHKPPKAKEVFFSTAALFPRTVTILPRTDFCFILQFLYITSFLVVVRRKGDCGEVAIQKKRR